MKWNITISIIILIIMIPASIYFIESNRDYESETANIIDKWSLIHLMAGFVLALILAFVFNRFEISHDSILPFVALSGALYEIIEHYYLENLAKDGGFELYTNIIADIVLVFLGGLIYVLMFDDEE